MIFSHKSLLLAAVAIALGSVAPLRAEAPEARALLARSLGAFKVGNLSAARRFANEATRADPSWGLAHAVAARTALATGDGASAEAALDRAKANGFDMRRVRQLVGEARLLQGDATRAITEADAARPRYAGYALRVKAQALAALGNPEAANAAFSAAVDADPGNAGLWADYGRFRQSAGDSAGAIAAADQALTLDANDTAALLLRARLMRDQFGLVASLPWFEAALQRDPQDFDALIDHAATLGDVGRATDMLATTRRALAVRPGAPQAMYLLAVLAARAGDNDLARGLMQKTGDRLSGVPGPLLLGAMLDLDAGGYQQAVGKLRNLIALQPMNIAARRLLGLALLRSGAARDALDVLRPIALRDDADSYTLTLAARAFEAVGDRVIAAELLDRAALPVRGSVTSFSADGSVPTLAAAANDDPAGEPATAVPLIRALIDGGDGGRALARAQAVAEANPGSPGAALVLGDVLSAVGQPGPAVVAYRRAANLRFDEPTMLRLTNALEANGDGAGAARVLATFLDHNPRNLAALRLAAHWQVAAGDYDAAIDTLEGLRARLGDRDAALLAALALAYDGSGADGPARSFAAAAYALAPSNAAAADAYGWTLFGAGDEDGALQLLQKAVTIAPVNPVLRWHLAQVYAAIGRAPEARFHALAALEDPRFADREAAMRVAG